MARDADDATPISSRRELVERLEAASRTSASSGSGRSMRRSPSTRRPTPGRLRESRHSRAIEGLEASLGWTVIQDRAPIGLYDPEAAAAISIEPGGHSSFRAPLAEPA